MPRRPNPEGHDPAGDHDDVERAREGRVDRLVTRRVQRLGMKIQKRGQRIAPAGLDACDEPADAVGQAGLRLQLVRELAAHFREAGKAQLADRTDRCGIRCARRVRQILRGREHRFLAVRGEIIGDPRFSGRQAGGPGQACDERSVGFHVSDATSLS